MRRRPEPNRRRGLLRAAATVVVLTILLVLAILVVSSLSAPSAKAPTAPTPPTSPGPITPVTSPTASHPGTATPAVHPSATAKKKVLGWVRGPRHATAPQLAPGIGLARAAPARESSGIAVRAGHLVASFGPSFGRPTDAPLLIRSTLSGTLTRVAAADPFVKPAWSTDGQKLLYVTVRAVGRYPGAEWTVWQYEVASHRSVTVAREVGLAVLPLGWWRGQPTYLVAVNTDTSIYSISSGRRRFVSILLPQAITSAALSPSGRFIAFAAPTACYSCTLDIFDMKDLSLWNGPTGVADESELAWTSDGTSLVTELHNTLVAVDAYSHDVSPLGTFPTLPHRWQHSLHITLPGSGAHVVDSVTGKPFTASRGSGAV